MKRGLFVEPADTETRFNQYEIRLANARQRVDDLDELLKLARQQRDSLIVEAVDAGLHPKRAGRAAGRSEQRVNQILGGG